MSKALEAAKRKGTEAAKAGKPRRCRYEDKRGGYNNMVTFSRAFRKAWFEGYDAGIKIGEEKP
jgi:hypothetical protein